MFNENWIDRKPTKMQQVYAETLYRFDNDQLEDEYFSTMLQIAETYHQITARPMNERPAAETQAKPVLDNLAITLQQILNEANSRRVQPIPVNPNLHERFNKHGAQFYSELVNAMDEDEIERELKSCEEAVEATYERIGDITAELRSGIRDDNALDDVKRLLGRHEESLKIVQAEIHQRQQNAKAEATEEQIERIMREIQGKALEDWMDEGGDLTEQIRSAMSFTLRLAAALPTEGRYEYKGWRYGDIVDRAQGGEAYLLQAYEQLKEAVENVECAIRRADAIRGIVTDKQKPDLSPMRDDGIPF